MNVETYIENQYNLETTPIYVQSTRGVIKLTSKKEQHHILKEEFKTYGDSYIFIDSNTSFAAGDTIKITDANDTSFLVIFGSGYSVPGATEAPIDLTITGAHYTIIDNQIIYWLYTPNKAIGDTITLTYAGRNVWRISYGDNLGQPDQALDWQVVNLNNVVVSKVVINPLKITVVDKPQATVDVDISNTAILDISCIVTPDGYSTMNNELILVPTSNSPAFLQEFNIVVITNYPDPVTIKIASESFKFPLNYIDPTVGAYEVLVLSFFKTESYYIYKSHTVSKI